MSHYPNLSPPSLPFSNPESRAPGSYKKSRHGFCSLHSIDCLANEESMCHTPQIPELVTPIHFRMPPVPVESPGLPPTALRLPPPLSPVVNEITQCATPPSCLVSPLAQCLKPIPIITPISPHLLPEHFTTHDTNVGTSYLSPPPLDHFRSCHFLSITLLQTLTIKVSISISPDPPPEAFS